VQYDRLRSHAASRPGPHPAPAAAGDSTATPAGSADTPTAQAARAVLVLAMLEHQILAAVLQIVSGPGGVASFLRRNLLGKGLDGPSRWTSARPTTSRSTCAAWWHCGIRGASSPADTSSKHTH